MALTWALVFLAETALVTWAFVVRGGVSPSSFSSSLVPRPLTTSTPATATSRFQRQLPRNHVFSSTSRCRRLQQAASSSSTTVDTARTTRNSSSSSRKTNKKNPDVWFHPSSSSRIDEIGDCIGRGSYGTVHLISITDDDDNDDGRWWIGKRAWTADELLLQQQQQQQQPDEDSASSSSSAGGEGGAAANKNRPNKKSTNKDLAERAERCRQYWTTERHCLERLIMHNNNNNNSNGKKNSKKNSNNKEDTTTIDTATIIDSSIAPYRGTAVDANGHEWMVFDIVYRADEYSATTTSSTSTTTTTTSSTQQQQQQQQQQQPVANDTIAPSLQQVMEQDRLDHLQHAEHHLYRLSQHLGLSSSRDDDDDNDATPSLTETLDVVITSVLETLQAVHAHKIVHRDLKPGNFLVTTATTTDTTTGDSNSDDDSDATASSTATGRLVLIDFGSAADLGTRTGFLGSSAVGVNDELVAVSPVYAAPELFIDPSNWHEACRFDCFSAGLLLCQLLLEYLDERTDAGFHQQLQAADWQLDKWLSQYMLQAKVRPGGLSDALDVLRERPGLWRLLKGLLQELPFQRLTAAQALADWKVIVTNGQQLQLQEEGGGGIAMEDVELDSVLDDGPFLRDLLQVSEVCLFADSPAVWPLHYVATFDRTRPLGLVLAERDAVWESDDDDDDDENDTTTDAAALRVQWERAISDAVPGEVFVQGIVPGGQAEEMEIIKVGDRLQGVGELPLAEGGFERAVEYLQDQPRSARYVTLHLDRKSAALLAPPPTTTAASTTAPQAAAAATAAAMTLSTGTNDTTVVPVTFDGPVQVLDQGAWSSLGRRKAQEDAFVLHEVHDTKDRSVLLAGVMDGHLGRAASHFVREELPATFSEEFVKARDGTAVETILELSWERTCETYQTECVSGEECAADYDPREGLLLANTGSIDTIAGTTTTLYALDKQTGHIAFLNCGDSRGLVVDRQGQIEFETVDHTPEIDYDRFVAGQVQGLDYSTPKCSFNTWRVSVGDYEYAVARSLEGPFATSKGIVCTPDVKMFQAEPESIVVVATDGLWEVIGSEQVARIVAKLRNQSVTAGDVAKTLCSLALEKGSSDNVSAVVVYLD